MKNTETFYGYTSDSFYNTTPEDAAQDAWDDGNFNVGDPVIVYALDFQKYSPSLGYRINDLLEEDAYENVGEEALGWEISNADELQNVVEKLAHEWLEKMNNMPSLWLTDL